MPADVTELASLLHRRHLSARFAGAPDGQHHQRHNTTPSKASPRFACQTPTMESSSPRQPSERSASTSNPASEPAPGGSRKQPTGRARPIIRGLGGGNTILVHPSQRKNPILRSIKGVGYEMADIVPDFQVGLTTCILYLRYVHDLIPLHTQTPLLAHALRWRCCLGVIIYLLFFYGL